MTDLRFVTTGLLAVALALPGVAMADDKKDKRQGKFEKRFEKLDINKDGKVSSEESLKARTLRFEKTDTNKDGEISIEEISAQMQKRQNERRAKRRFNRMDYNGDGKVTLEEINDRASKRFALLDSNNDGVLDKAEMRRGQKMWRKNRRNKRKKHRRSDSDTDD